MDACNTGSELDLGVTTPNKRERIRQSVCTLPNELRPECYRSGKALSWLEKAEGGDRKVLLCPDIKDSLPKIGETHWYVPGCAKLEGNDPHLTSFGSCGMMSFITAASLCAFGDEAIRR